MASLIEEKRTLQEEKATKKEKIYENEMILKEAHETLLDGEKRLAEEKATF